MDMIMMLLVLVVLVALAWYFGYLARFGLGEWAKGDTVWWNDNGVGRNAKVMGVYGKVYQLQPLDGVNMAQVALPKELAKATKDEAMGAPAVSASKFRQGQRVKAEGTVVTVGDSGVSLIVAFDGVERTDGDKVMIRQSAVTAA